MLPETIISGNHAIPAQFFLSVGVALAASAPIGPISILTIQRALSLGFWRAFLPTLGAVIANGIFGVIAALGTGYLTSAIMGSEFWLRLTGSVILTAMGVRFFTHQRRERDVSREGFGPFQVAFLNFTLVLSNPLTLGFYLAAFALLGLRSEHLFAPQSLILGGGMVSGALLWFSFICLLAGRFHLKVDEKFLRRVRTAIGILFIFLGLVSALTALGGRQENRPGQPVGRLEGFQGPAVLRLPFIPLP